MNDDTLDDRFGPMLGSSVDSFKDESAYREELAFRRQYDSIMATYQKGWVAMLDGNVIAHDTDYENLHRRLRETHPSQHVYLRELTALKAYREPKRVGSPRICRPPGIIERLVYFVRKVLE